MVALRHRPGDAGLLAPAHCCAEPWADGEGLILPGALRQGCLCRLDIRCPARGPIPGGEAPAPPNLSACPGARPCPQRPREPSAPARDLWMLRQDGPPPCPEGFGGLPLPGSDAWRCQSPSGELSRAATPVAPASQPPPKAQGPLGAHGPVLRGAGVGRCPRAAAWLQPGEAASPVPRACLEFLPALRSSVNLILPDLHGRLFFVCFYIYWC